MRELLSRLLVPSALLSVLLIGSTPAVAGWDPRPTIPATGLPYKCDAKKITDPNAEWLDVRLSFTQFPCNKLADGNTLCRPVYGVNTYPEHPDWPPLNTLVTTAKPVSCGNRCSTWEYTVNRPFQAQCKRFKVFEDHTGGHYLQFMDCSTGYVQTCVRPWWREPKPIPGIP